MGCRHSACPAYRGEERSDEESLFLFDLSTKEIARCAQDLWGVWFDSEQFSFSGSKHEITVSRHATREHILETT